MLKSRPTPTASEIIIVERPVASPSKLRLTNVPQPAGTVAPVNEKARTVEPPVDIVKPADPASPPLPAEAVVPSTAN